VIYISDRIPIMTPYAGRPIDHRTIERRFAPALKKGRHCLARMLRSQLVRRAIAGDTAALIFACKTILGLREPRSDEFNVQVSAMATAAAKPAVRPGSDRENCSVSISNDLEEHYKYFNYP
jgi:hypothetical protein